MALVSRCGQWVSQAYEKLRIINVWIPKNLLIIIRVTNATHPGIPQPDRRPAKRKMIEVNSTNLIDLLLKKKRKNYHLRVLTNVSGLTNKNMENDIHSKSYFL